MKLILKSIQDYETHKDEFTEEFNCSIEQTDTFTKILFENGYIQIEDNKIIRVNGENQFTIEQGVATEVDYETENGLMVLDTFGMEFEKNDIKDEVFVRAKYEIRIVGVDTYTNELIIRIKS